MNATPVGLYGRLGPASVVNEKAREALQAGALVKQDDLAGTVEATLQGETLFKAIRKGPKGQPWLVMYNPKFYPKP